MKVKNKVKNKKESINTKAPKTTSKEKLKNTPVNSSSLNKKTNSNNEISKTQTTNKTDLVNETKTPNFASTNSLKIPGYSDSKIIEMTTNVKTIANSGSENLKSNIENDDKKTTKARTKINLKKFQKSKLSKEQLKEAKKKIREIRKMNKPHKSSSTNKNLKLESNEIIKLSNVEKYATNGYQYEHILKGIDLTIYKGEFVVIVGPSGSGKTTLLTILSALDRPSKGDCLMFNNDTNTITLNQSKLTKLRARHVGYIFQQYGLLQDLSVADNIKIAANLYKDKNKTNLDLDKLLDSVGLLKHKNQKALNLSGGQAQRVAICRALIKNPDILFGDEPTGAIHVNATKEIMNIFLDINKQFKTTVIIVTHNNAITELADRVIKIESGKVKENYLNKRRKSVEEINWSL